MLVSRVELADLVTLGRRTDWPREEVEEVQPPGAATDCVVVWRDNDVSIPAALVIMLPLDEFYAWSTTYLAHLTPLSALMRVTKSAAQVTKCAEFPKGGTLGLMFAEIAIEKATRRDIQPPKLADFMSSLTFCLAQAKCYSDSPSAQELASLWQEARHLLRIPRAPFAVSDILEVWEAVHQVKVGEQSPAPEALDLFAYSARKESMARGTADVEVDEVAPQYADLMGKLGEGPIEDRVRTFKELARLAAATEPGNGVGRVLGGGLSKVSGGTFRHARLLDPWEVGDARPLLWYGWYEALASARRGRPWFGEWPGLRLRVEAARKWNAASWPDECDIALEELRVLSGQDRSREKWGTRRRGFARVQLHEGVAVEFALESPSRRTGRDANPQSHSSRRGREVK